MLFGRVFVDLHNPSWALVAFAVGFDHKVVLVMGKEDKEYWSRRSTGLMDFAAGSSEAIRTLKPF